MGDTKEGWKRFAIDKVAEYEELQKMYSELQNGCTQLQIKHIELLKTHNATLLELRDTLKAMSSLQDEIKKLLSSQL